MSEIMNGYWNELKGEALKTWGNLTHNELDQVAGDAKKLEGLLQQKYGHSVEEAKMQKFWGDLTDNDVDKINGSRTRLVGTLQEKHGKSRSKALEEVDHFLKEIS